MNQGTEAIALESAQDAPPAAPWYVYMVRCSDNSLYTGITTDPARRLAEHNSGKKGAKYTRTRQPVHLVYQEHAGSRSAAAKREYRLKKLTLGQKTALINEKKPAKRQESIS